MIQNDVIDTAKKEGRAEGHKEALLQTAKRMKGLGIADEIVAQSTGLPLEEVRGI